MALQYIYILILTVGNFFSIWRIKPCKQENKARMHASRKQACMQRGGKREIVKESRA